jgi:DNA gyrase subunit A
MTAGEVPDLADGLTRSERRVLGVLTSAYVRSQDAVEGDQGLYEVLVRMAQSFAVRYPLVEGLGNFGNNDGWPAADIQYTQARRAPIGADAACFPLLLVNGAPGIPPHNLREVIAATLAYLDDPEIGVEQLLEHITGPDFPTGAITPMARLFRRRTRQARARSCYEPKRTSRPETRVR